MGYQISAMKAFRPLSTVAQLAGHLREEVLRGRLGGWRGLLTGQDEFSYGLKDSGDFPALEWCDFLRQRALADGAWLW